MSTYLYLVCLDHDPELWAEGESGQHLFELDQIRADIANRDALVAAVAVGAEVPEYFRQNTVRFLTRHPKCRVGIRDEYEREHPIEVAEAFKADRI